jgi:hypothetical protein
MKENDGRSVDRFGQSGAHTLKISQGMGALKLSPGFANLGLSLRSNVCSVDWSSDCG